MAFSIIIVADLKLWTNKIVNQINYEILQTRIQCGYNWNQLKSFSRQIRRLRTKINCRKFKISSHTLKSPDTVISLYQPVRTRIEELEDVCLSLLSLHQDWVITMLTRSYWVCCQAQITKHIVFAFLQHYFSIQYWL